MFSKYLISMTLLLWEKNNGTRSESSFKLCLHQRAKASVNSKKFLSLFYFLWIRQNFYFLVRWATIQIFIRLEIMPLMWELCFEARIMHFSLIGFGCLLAIMEDPVLQLYLLPNLKDHLVKKNQKTQEKNLPLESPREWTLNLKW